MREAKSEALKLWRLFGYRCARASRWPRNTDIRLPRPMAAKAVSTPTERAQDYRKNRHETSVTDGDQYNEGSVYLERILKHVILRMETVRPEEQMRLIEGS
jgi:hypothetical protein